LVLIDSINSSSCSKKKEFLNKDLYFVFFLFSLSLIGGGVLLAVNDRLIGGNGGLVRLETPAVELNGVRGLVI